MVPIWSRKMRKVATETEVLMMVVDSVLNLLTHGQNKKCLEMLHKDLGEDHCHLKGVCAARSSYSSSFASDCSLFLFTFHTPSKCFFSSWVRKRSDPARSSAGFSRQQTATVRRNRTCWVRTFIIDVGWLCLMESNLCILVRVYQRQTKDWK